MSKLICNLRGGVEMVPRVDSAVKVSMGAGHGLQLKDKQVSSQKEAQHSWKLVRARSI